jgi:hypothetical protein
MEFLYLFMWSFLTLLFTSHHKTGLLLEGLVLRTATRFPEQSSVSCFSGGMDPRKQDFMIQRTLSVHCTHEIVIV